MSNKKKLACNLRSFMFVGELIKRWGRVPFLPGQSPPPFMVRNLTCSFPDYFNLEAMFMYLVYVH